MSWKDIEHGLKADEQEKRIRRNEKRAGKTKDLAHRVYLVKGILDARHQLGR
jgi:hypothetical protein